MGRHAIQIDGGDATPGAQPSGLLGVPTRAQAPTALLERLEQGLPTQTGPVPVQGPRSTAPVTDPRLFDAPLPARRPAPAEPRIERTAPPAAAAAPAATSAAAAPRRNAPAAPRTQQPAVPGTDRAATASIRAIRTGPAIAPQLPPLGFATRPGTHGPVLLPPAPATQRLIAADLTPRTRTYTAPSTSAPPVAPAPAFRRGRSASLAACAVAVLGAFSTAALLLPHTSSAESGGITNTVRTEPHTAAAKAKAAGSHHARAAGRSSHSAAAAHAAPQGLAARSATRTAPTHAAPPTTAATTATATAAPIPSATPAPTATATPAPTATATPTPVPTSTARHRAPVPSPMPTPAVTTTARTGAFVAAGSTTIAASGTTTPSNAPTPSTSPTATTPSAPAASPSPSPTATHTTGSFVSGSTKPSASNTGAGVIRAYPTRVIEGNVTLTGNQSLKDVIVHGRVSVKGTGNVIENCVITGSKDASYSGSVWLVNTSSAKDAVVRFTTIRSITTSAQVNGIGLRNVTAERNDISRVIDGFDIDPGSGTDVNTTIKDNWIHDLMFVGPGSGHNATPTPSSYTGPWARTSWSHDDAIQITGGRGLKIVGNAFDARWASDIGTTPLPTIVKELSVLMLNAHNGPVTGLEMRDNWIDGGEYAVNGGGGSGSGTFTGNRFGSHIQGPSDAPWTLMFGSGFHASTSGNVYEASGDPIRVRTNA